MNFFGLHTYPEGDIGDGLGIVGPEPLVWIGLKEDVNPDGTVKKAYHSRHFTTMNGTWGYQPLKTSDYTFDAGQLFNQDDFGADYMKISYLMMWVSSLMMYSLSPETWESRHVLGLKSHWYCQISLLVN